VNAILRTRYGVQPGELPDGEWFDLYAEYKFVEELEFKNQKAAVISALADVIAQVTGSHEQQYGQ
jgi:hypothetical protein